MKSLSFSVVRVSGSVSLNEVICGLAGCTMHEAITVEMWIPAGRGLHFEVDSRRRERQTNGFQDPRGVPSGGRKSSWIMGICEQHVFR
nr:hypothetical protein CFP56_34931 [Quercus suber]